MFSHSKVFRVGDFMCKKFAIWIWNFVLWVHVFNYKNKVTTAYVAMILNEIWQDKVHM